MCVIAFVDEDTPRPSESMVGKMYLANEHGAGVAWRETNNGQTLVRWRKGLDMDAVQRLVKEVPKPFVIHFRIPSVGGPHKSLNHPFTVDPAALITMEGTTTGSVLFHNGTWQDWRKFSLDTASRSPEKFPTGRWSDSRALAWNASIYGLGILEIINEKVIVFGPEDIHIFGDGWGEEEGVFVSNKGWKSRHWPTSSNNSSYHGTVPASVAEMGPKKTLQLPGKSGGTSQQGTFRTEESSRGINHAGEGGDQRQQAEGRPETVLSDTEEEDDGQSRFISCVRAGFDDDPLKIDNHVYEADLTSLERNGRDAELKSWALLLQDNPAKRGPAKIIDLASEKVERSRRLENQRRGIVHLGRM
jgi:hypothetical protein